MKKKNTLIRSRKKEIFNFVLFFLFFYTFNYCKCGSENEIPVITMEEYEKMKRETGKKVVIICGEEYVVCFKKESVKEMFTNKFLKVVKIYWLEFDFNHNFKGTKKLKLLPAIHIIGDGQFYYKKNGEIVEKELQNIVHGLYRKWISGRTTVYTKASYDLQKEKLTKEFGHIGIFKINEEDQKAIKEFSEIAEKLNNNKKNKEVYFIVVMNPNLSFGTPAVFKLKNIFDEVDVKVYSENEPLSAETVEKFVTRNRNPFLISINNKMFNSIFESSKLILFITSSEKIEKLVEELVQNEESLSEDIAVLVFDQENSSLVKKHYKFTKNKTVLFFGTKNSKYLFTGVPTVDNIKKFIFKIKNKEVPKYMLSENVNSKGKAPFRKLVYNNFIQKIQEENRHKLILYLGLGEIDKYYMQELEFLVGLLKDPNSLFIYTFDTVNNSIPGEGFHPKKIPQIAILPMDTKKIEWISEKEFSSLDVRGFLDVITKKLPDLELLDHYSQLITEHENKIKDEKERQDKAKDEFIKEQNLKNEKSKKLEEEHQAEIEKIIEEEDGIPENNENNMWRKISSMKS